MARPRMKLDLFVGKNYRGIPPTLAEFLNTFFGSNKDVFEIKGKLVEEPETSRDEVEEVSITVKAKHPGLGPNAIARKLYREATGREVPRGKESLSFTIRVKKREDPNQTEMDLGDKSDKKEGEK